MRTSADLHPFQWNMVREGLRRPSAAFFADVGTGKTVATLTLLDALRDEGKVFGTIIAAPLRVCRTVWQQEAESWTHLQGRFTFALCCGERLRRNAAIAAEPDILLVNYENLDWLVDELLAHYCSWKKRIPYQMVVFDELSRVAESQTKRSKAVQRLRNTGQIDRWLGLTATPATNGLVKLHGEYLALDGGTILGRGKTNFQYRWFYPSYDGYSWLPKLGTPQALADLIAPVTTRASKKDLKEQMPAVSTQDIVVSLPPKVHKEYKQLEDQFYVALDEGEVEAFNAAAKVNKCIQFANGHVYRANGANRPQAADFIPAHTAKLDALVELIDQLEGQPLLVCYVYRMDVVRIKEKVPGAVDFKDAAPETIVERWNQGKIPVLLGHPASMGHGLNLQFGGHHICWFGLTHDLELYEQAIGRLDRQGQTEPVIVHRIMADKTMDKAVAGALAGKDLTQRQLLNAVQEYRNG